MNKKLILMTWGGLGDLLICTPLFKALKQRYPQREIIVYCVNKDRKEILKHNPYIDSLRLLDPLHMWRYPLHLFFYVFGRNKISYTSLEFHHIWPSLYDSIHVKDIAGQIFGLKLLGEEKQMQLFFTSEEEKKMRLRLSKYKVSILMHIHSIASDNHHWPIDSWNKVVSKLQQYTFIQIGHQSHPYVEGAVDWRGKTTIREALCLLKFSTSFVGVDSIFAHATNAFSTPGVVLFGDSSPVQVGHPNNINIFKNVRCSPCYYYLGGNPCPYDHECMNLITVNEIVDAIVRQVNKSLERVVS
jgi:ADP-heptose:LPS heptosyltransferase